MRGGLGPVEAFAQPANRLCRPGARFVSEADTAAVNALTVDATKLVER